MNTPDEQAMDTGQPIHEFRSGCVAVTISEAPTTAGRNFQLSIAFSEDGAAPQPLMRCAGTHVADLRAVLAQVAKLIEYLEFGFSYEIWREDYDPTYRPECRPPTNKEDRP